MQINRLLLCLLLLSTWAQAQIIIKGKITNEDGSPLEKASVIIGNQESLSDTQGNYQLKLAQPGTYLMQVILLNYETFSEEKYLSENQILNFQLFPEIIELEENVLHHKHQKNIENTQEIKQDFLTKEFSGSLAKSLEKLPGIQSMEIGSGTSKPVIRGLGFNRISVAENGIKQEGQQWGADHGLELNPLSVEKINIIKGAGTLEYGSDAMGGIIAIQNNQKPRYNSFSGDWNLYGRSANQALGSALNLQGRKDNYFGKFSANWTEFGDYKIPTSHIRYLDREIPIFQEELKNTAGKDWAISTQLGYTTRNFETVFNLSDYYQKIGFFPGAHGVPDLTRIQPDGNRRNIDFPYQNVNHFKLNNETTWNWHDSQLKLIFGYQNNHRQEWSEFHTHYGNLQVAPTENPDLELDFRLATYDAQAKFQQNFSKQYKFSLGIQSQIQDNNRKGYSFLLPEFNRTNLGAYVINEWLPNEKWNFNYGLRFDYTQLDIAGFYDSILYQFLIQNGQTEEDAENLAQRSADVQKSYRNLNYSLGALFQPNKNLDFNLNLSSNFRVPTAIELASNGIHHGSFRHEKGNPNLDPEKGWSADLKISYHPQTWNFEVNPYFYYFQNYIFLEPSIRFSPLPHGGQIYQYNQSEAILTGWEFKIEKSFGNRLKGEFAWEYLYNQQISEGNRQDYPLPFSPPMTFFSEWNYEFIQNGKFFKNLSISVNLRHATQQDRIARNEEITQAYTLLGGGIFSQIQVGKFQADIFLTGQNLTNEKYFNHMSFYRALEIPEMGRNIQLILRIPFGKN